MLGIAASGVMVWYERRIPRRKRIGYRVQLESPIGDDARSGRINRRLGLFDEAPGMTDATLVLIRIENDGSQSIDRDDYTGPELHGLRENRLAVSLFSLVVNKDAEVKDLSTADVRRLYRGEITNWSELGGRDVAVRLVSRDANSGTRQVLQHRVLGRGEIANSSLDCRHKDDPTAPVLRCELDSTELVLRTVAGLPGSIGYSEFNRAAAAQGVDRLSLDGNAPSVDALERGDHSYPFREIEYAYTYGRPPANSLASSFLTYLTRGIGQDVVHTHGHLPCLNPGIQRLCADPGL
ncbi:substrate-binding domain-containing protein [Streptomyces hirsutus]|uniref:substrate-binding domain-containing protein n=1 Tax=Streptomyces hirsutus TaxID=35620 RepID=UPI0036C6BEF5